MATQDLNAVMLAELAALKAENAKLKATQAEHSNVTFKVTKRKPDKVTGEMSGTEGLISAYGLNRFPVTLREAQWLRLFGMVSRFEAFIKANADSIDHD